MALQNRVHPDGSLHAKSARGTMLGNRGGRMHDPSTKTLKTGKPWAGKQWISCRLAFNGRARDVWGQSYTELFFLDEVSALAAGHRPCFECRRQDAKAFQAALFSALADQQSWQKPPKVALIDALLHEERTGETAHRLAIETLPVGSMFLHEQTVFAVTPTGMRGWSWQGYGEAVNAAKAKLAGDVDVLTPPTMIAALRAGYAPLWHPSAEQASDPASDPA